MKENVKKNVYLYMRLPQWLSRKESTCNKEIQVQPLGHEDSLEKVMPVHSRIPSWKIPWTEGLCRLQLLGLQELDATF